VDTIAAPLNLDRSCNFRSIRSMPRSPSRMTDFGQRQADCGHAAEADAQREDPAELKFAPMAASTQPAADVFEVIVTPTPGAQPSASRRSSSRFQVCRRRAFLVIFSAQLRRRPEGKLLFRRR